MEVSQLERLRQERIDELNDLNKSVEFGGVNSPARYDYEDFKDGLKLLLSYCLTEQGQINIHPDIQLALGRSSRLPVQLTNKLVVEDAYFRLKPRCQMVLLLRHVQHKRLKQMEWEMHYTRETLEAALREAYRAMFEIICRE